ncbi:Isoleucine N-monooxygenase [Arachis hypogaea]|nr:Isoleucine N-monooxygenase [Arachis hypogaea]
MLFCIIILLFIKLLKLNDSRKKSKKPRLPPGPKPWPIVGNLPQMLANKPTLRWIQNIMNDLNTEIACIRLGNVHVIPVTSPSIAREILMKQDAIFASRPLSWSRQHYGGNLIRRLLFNKRYFGNGREDGGPGAEELEYVEAQFMVKILKKAINTLRKYHDPIIEERICQWRNGTRTHQEDWLDVLISLKDANNNPFLTLHEIKSQIMEIAVGTMDNLYNNVEWVLSEIINQPEILQKAIEELDKVVGKKRLVQESDIPKLNYVKACLREGFRLHPINDFNILHVSMKDTTVANYFIPKGSHILIRKLGIGQNPRVWNEPLKFKPERHLKKDGYDLTLTESNLELFTFGTGRRSCPAITLGTTVTVMLFARLVHGFTWIAPPNELSINLSELENDTTKVKPLVALGKPRLPPEVYHQIN